MRRIRSPESFSGNAVKFLGERVAAVIRAGRAHLPLPQLYASPKKADVKMSWSLTRLSLHEVFRPRHLAPGRTQELQSELLAAGIPL
jgi:hypothetical protein